MSAGHRAVIEVGPATIRRICCGEAEPVDSAATLQWIDDPLGMVQGRPVVVFDLLGRVLACSRPAESVTIIHPSWWPTRRVELLERAATPNGGHVITRSRSTVLTGACQAGAVVEIAAGLVAVCGGAEISALPRTGDPAAVADSVAGQVLALLGDRRCAVVIDAPAGVGGAPALAAMIQRLLRPEFSATVLTALPALQSENAEPEAEAVDPPTEAARRWRHVPVGVAAGLAFAVVLAFGAVHESTAANGARELVAGRVAVQVPGDWLVRRVAGVTGAPRVEVASPADPQVVLHITQAPAAFGDLAAVAEALQRGLWRAEIQTPGVFLGFDATGFSAGRAAVTYREVRAGRQIDWSVLVDGAVRIGIGCQSGANGAKVLRSVCEQAVRSAHALW